MTPQIKTLGDLKKVGPMFGATAMRWIEDGISQSPLGEDEPVLADDAQIMALLLNFSDAEHSLVQGEADEHVDK